MNKNLKPEYLTTYPIHGKRRKRPRPIFRVSAQILLLIALFAILNHADFMRIREFKVNIDGDTSLIDFERLFIPDDYVGMNLIYFPYQSLRISIEQYPSVAYAKVTPWPPGTVTVDIILYEPEIILARQCGFYLLDKNGRFIAIAPSYLRPPQYLKFPDEHILFDDHGKPHDYPTSGTLIRTDKQISDKEMLLALGYADMLYMRDYLIKQTGIPTPVYFGYHDRYGLMLKCEKKPLILLGFGNDLMAQITRAIKVVTDDQLPYGEDHFIDIRYDVYQSAKQMWLLRDSFMNPDFVDVSDSPSDST